MMSTLYLPDGSKIIMHTSWRQSQEANGNLSLYSNDDEKKYLGTITNSGTVHLTRLCSHTHYPAPLRSLDSAYTILMDHLKDLPDWKLRDLKRAISHFDAKSCRWK